MSAHAESAAPDPRLLIPTNENRLRVIGRELDRVGYRSVHLVEITGGFLVRATQPGQRLPAALEFPHEEFQKLIGESLAARGDGLRPAPRHPLLPTGYQDFLRALGHQLDQMHVEAVAITELEELIAVTGVAPVETYEHTVMGPYQALFRASDIASLIEEAFRRRAAPPAQPASRRFLRVPGR